MTDVNVERPYGGRRLWLLWMGATVAAVVAYSIALFVVSMSFGLNSQTEPQPGGRVEPWIGVLVGVLSAAGFGGAIGLAQWMVLRKALAGTGGWVPATLVGYSLIVLLVPVAGAFGPGRVSGPIALITNGAVIGVLQWLVLRGRVYQAGWWIAINTAGWALAIALTVAAYLSGLYVEPFDLLAAFLVPVAVSGGGMVWLLGRPAPVIRESG